MDTPKHLAVFNPIVPSQSENASPILVEFLSKKKDR